MSANNITTDFYVGQDLENTSSDEYKSITTSKKVAFSDGNEFTFDGVNYTGYYNYDGTNFYKTKTLKDDKLTVVENINTDILDSNKFFDRTIFTKLNPSYVLDDILFKPNEIINKNSINFKLNLLYDNFIDLYRFSNINNPLIPTDFNAYAVLSTTSTSTEWQWVSSDVRFISGGLDPSLVSFSAYNEQFFAVDKMNTIALKSTKEPDEYTLFVTTSSYLFAYQLDRDDTMFDFVLSADSIGIDGKLRFENITSIAADKENNILYLNDRGKQQIYKADTKTIINKDRTGVRQIQLLETIGGKGSDNTNFNDNTYIEYGNGNIFVYDDIDKSIKKFSDKFVFKLRYANKNLFEENKFVSMTYNTTFDLLYVLTETYRVVVLNANNFEEIDRYVLTSNPFEFAIPLIGKFELPSKIVFSKNDSNIYYLQTTKNVYKYFLNTQTKNIERFTIDINFDSVSLWNTVFARFSAYEVEWDDLPDFDKFAIASNGLQIIDSDVVDTDKLLLWSNKRVFSFNEDNNYVSLLNTSRPNFYKKSEIFLKDEYFNNITFNSTIFRHLFNLNLLSSNLNKQLLAVFDTVETDGYLRFKDFLELSHEDKEILDLNNQKQYFAGVNETLNGNTLNRIMTNLFEYQNNIIQSVETKRIGERIPILKTVLLDK
tara:strand:- start:4244 stop:6214 length:1971 start_codon:yes stop_codon:yes gene_type:complete